MTHDFATLQPDYQKNIDNMEIRDEDAARIDNIARRIIKHKEQYQQVADAMAPKDNSRIIPWQLIGAIHYRESDLDFSTHLHNGDPLTARTYHVPAGRPIDGDPPYSWVDSAIDALEMKGWQKVKDWTLPYIAYKAEEYNGFGYRAHNVSDPYLWSGTNDYDKGKYVSDGNFDASVVDRQMGIMPIIYRTLALDVDNSRVASGSRTLTLIPRVKSAIIAAGGGYFTLDSLNAVPTYITNAKALGLPIYAWLAIAGCAGFWFVLSIIENYRMQEYKNGNYTPSSLVPNKVDSSTPLTK